MFDTDRLTARLSDERRFDSAFGPSPGTEEIRPVVRELKADGLCGRRIAEHRLGPFFISNPKYGQREIELLDAVLTEEYEGTDLCVETRNSECSRLRGGCKGSR